MCVNLIHSQELTGQFCGKHTPLFLHTLVTVSEKCPVEVTSYNHGLVSCESQMTVNPCQQILLVFRCPLITYLCR